jgi:hypothetical protein
MASARALEFAVTFDYRCPFARNVHEHVLAGLDAGSPWTVTFWAFSLDQIHVEAGEPAVWDDASKRPDLLALSSGLAVREGWPDRFPAVHAALFAARHDHGQDIRDEGVIAALLEREGVDPEAVLERVASGAPLQTLRAEHERAVTQHQVFGVPTLVVDGRAAFVRLMTRPNGDAPAAVASIERLVDLVAGWADLNELKHTTVPR